MTEQDIDLMEQLHQKALDGPWHCGHNDAPEPTDFVVCESANSSIIAWVRFGKDGRLIAALRSNAAELCRLARIGLKEELWLKTKCKYCCKPKSHCDCFSGRPADAD